MLKGPFWGRPVVTDRNGEVGQYGKFLFSLFLSPTGPGTGVGETTESGYTWGKDCRVSHPTPSEESQKRVSET